MCVQIMCVNTAIVTSQNELPQLPKKGVIRSSRNYQVWFLKMLPSSESVNSRCRCVNSGFLAFDS